MANQGNGQPDFEAFDNFWKVSILLNLICLEKLVVGLERDQDRHFDDDTRRWHLFLNHFASLGDIDKAGKTVTATLGAMHESDRILFVAANNGVRPEIEEHLRSMLSILQNLDVKSLERRKAAQRQIFKAVVTEGSEKIQDWFRRLMKHHEILSRRFSKSNDQADLDLLKKIQQFEKLEKTHTHLCKAAYLFRESEHMKHLDKRRCEGPASEIWTRTRHFIGRLGSWYRSSRNLVRIAVQNRSLLHGLQLRSIQQPDLTNLANLARLAPRPDHETFVNLINHLFPDSMFDEVVETLERMRSKDQGMSESDTEPDVNLPDAIKNKSIECVFSQRLKQARKDLSVHAEIVAVDYMHEQGHQYINGDRYVGCSKPSCFSCHLYLQHHPGNIVRRSCHGNLWSRWCPGNFANRLYNNQTCIQIMTEIMAEEVKNRVMEKRQAGKRLPDSLTGMTISTTDLRNRG